MNDILKQEYSEQFDKESTELKSLSTNTVRHVRISVKAGSTQSVL